jgi:hypothetical protein
VGDSFSYTIDDVSGATSNVASVAITVNPANGAPLINDQVMSVGENSTVGTSVGTVAASDPDTGDSLVYAITGGNLGGVFAIDPATGDVFVVDSAPLDFETNPSISLTVEVEDLTGVRRSAIVTVNVLNVNEAVTISGPAGLSMDVSKSLVFSSAKGTAITIGDPDGLGAPLEVTLSAGGGTLTLESTGGLTMLAGDGMDDPAMTFRGSLANVTTALEGLRLDASDTGTVSVGVSVADLAAGGGSESASFDVAVHATPTTTYAEPPPGSKQTPESLPPTPIDPGIVPPPTPVDTPPAVELTVPAPPPVAVESPEPRWFEIERDSAEVAPALGVDEARGESEKRDREERLQVDLLRPGFMQLDFFQALDQMRAEVLEGADGDGDADRNRLAPALKGMAMAATTGMLAGVLRASSLLTMAVSSVPFWKRADPLTVLSLSKEERRDFEANLRSAGAGERSLDAVLEGGAEAGPAHDDDVPEDA